MIVKPCKFCGMECLRSDRARADCYVCVSVRDALQQYPRLVRENSALTTRVRELETELEKLKEAR